MSDIIIRIENLGKKYVLNHQSKARGYKSLREAISNNAKAFSRSLTNPRKSKNSTLRHEEFWALNNVSFNISRGDCVGIIGRNGAGKSTLLKILSRITEPTKGKVKIQGRVASLLEVGTGFHPELTGRENIFLNGAILGMSKEEIKRKFDEIVYFSEIEKFLDTPVKRYSSGMYVRLAFAVAAHLEPEILVVDEVLAVGDSAFQKKCLGKMQDVSSNEGRTVLFVSHNLAAVQQLCSRTVVLDKGSLRFDGDVQKGLSEYLTENLVSRQEISLKERQDREGEQELILTHIGFNFDHKENVLLLGKDPLSLRICIESRLAFPHPVRFRLSIYNQFEQRVLIGDSEVSGYSLEVMDEKMCFAWNLTNHVGLFPGDYSINISVYAHGAMQDYIQRAFEFSVIEGDFFNSGRIADGEQIVLAQQMWKSHPEVNL